MHPNLGAPGQGGQTHALTLSRSRDGYAPVSSPDASLATSAHGHHHNRDHAPNITTPLLMPPPSTFLGEIQHRLILMHHLASRYLGGHAGLAAFLVRLGLFLLKIVSLTRPCWPYSINPRIGASLVTVAALDLGIPVATTANNRGRDLMPGGPRDSRGGEGPALRSHALPSHDSSWWQWGLVTSALLFLLHFFVLWLTSRFGAMCATTRENWMDFRFRDGELLPIK
jgi:hypothetical protein